MKFEMDKLEKIVLRNLDQLKDESDRGYIHVSRLWFSLNRSIKIKDPQEAYRRHYAALELLREKGLIKERAGSTPLSDGDVRLTSKGIKEIDKINRGFLRRLYYYFERDIKSEFVKYFLMLLAFLIGVSFSFLKSPASKELPLEIPVIKNQKIPECFLGRCPEYSSMDVDGDDLSESLIIIPTAMTQGTGKLWVIDEGKVVFESDEMMRIGVRQTVEQREVGNGFILLYATEVNSTEGSEIKFVYQDGQFKPEGN